MRVSSRIAATLLVVVNVGVAIFALSQHRGYADLLLIYCSETLVIGALNIPKLLIAALFGERTGMLESAQNAGKQILLVLTMLIFYIPIFVLAVMALYFGITFLPGMLERADYDAGFILPRVRTADDHVVESALIALALSHGFSFIVNFLFGREFRRTSLLRLTVQPFLRIALVVAVIAVAGTIAYHQPFVARTTMFAVVVVLLKISADLYSHLAERRAFRTAMVRGLPR